MANIKELLGAKIRAARVNARFSQRELAVAADIKGKNTIPAIEAGDTWPAFETIEAIARALNVLPESLFSFSQPSALDALRVVEHIVQSHTLGLTFLGGVLEQKISSGKTELLKRVAKLNGSNVVSLTNMLEELEAETADDEDEEEEWEEDDEDGSNQ